MIERRSPMTKEMISHEIARLEAEIASTKEVYVRSVEDLKARSKTDPYCELEIESTTMVYKASMEALKERISFYKGLSARRK
jgi:hypothetical protein